MPRKREKSRTQHLIDALEAAQKAGVCLAEIDLRHTAGTLRDTLKEARANQEALCVSIGSAIKQDAAALAIGGAAK